MNVGVVILLHSIDSKAWSHTVARKPGSRSETYSVAPAAPTAVRLTVDVCVDGCKSDIMHLNPRSAAVCLLLFRPLPFLRTTSTLLVSLLHDQPTIVVYH